MADVQKVNPDTTVAPAFSLHWKERVVVGMVMILGFMTSFEACGIGPPISVSLDSDSTRSVDWKRIPFFMLANFYLEIIAQSLDATITETTWIGSGFFIGSAAFQPTFASMSHIFGRRPVTTGALLIFLAGTIICSAVHSIGPFLVGRVIQGIGGGGCNAMMNVLITDLVPLHKRGQYFGFVSMAWAMGVISGMILGSVFGQKATWRWIFWILIPFNVVSILITLFFVRLRRKDDEVQGKLSQIDYLGALIFAASSTSFLLGITFGGSQYPWSSWHTLVPLILGLFGMAVFIVWEIYGTAQPMIPMRIFSTVTATQGYLGVAFIGMVMWGVIYYMPLYYEGVLGYSFIIGAVAILPLSLTLTPTAAVTGQLISRTGRYRRFLWIGWLFTILGLGLFLDLGEHTTVAQWIFLTIIAGVGVGNLLSTTQIAVQASVRISDVSMASAMVGEIRTLGQAIGIAIFGAVFSNITKHSLSNSPAVSKQTTDELSNNVFLLVETIKRTSDGPEKDAFVHALWLGHRAIWITALPMAAAIGILSLWAKDLSLSRAMESQHVVVQEENVVGDVEQSGAPSNELEHMEPKQTSRSS